MPDINDIRNVLLECSNQLCDIQISVADQRPDLAAELGDVIENLRGQEYLLSHLNIKTLSRDQIILDIAKMAMQKAFETTSLKEIETETVQYVMAIAVDFANEFERATSGA